MLTPSLYSIATFCSQAVELVIKIPLETVLRRGQLAVALSASHRKPFEPIVEIGAYKGLFGTMRHIMYEEGEKAPSLTSLPKGGKGGADSTVTKNNRAQKGQGVEGLYRGWRVGLWALLGVWGAATMGTGKGGEF